MSTFKKEAGNWTAYRDLPDVFEVDFHYGEGSGCYGAAMDDVRENVLAALRSAYEEGYRYVLFRHGYSTSRIGKTSSRSVVREVMRGRESTPFVVKSQSIQHYSVFVAAIRETATGTERRRKAKEKQQKEDDQRQKRAEEKIPQLMRSLLEIVDRSPHESFRIGTRRYFDSLINSDELSSEEVVGKIDLAIHNYKSQFERQCGVYDPDRTF